MDWSCSSKALTSPSASESAAAAPASSSGSKLLGAEEMEATRLDEMRIICIGARPGGVGRYGGAWGGMG